MPNLVDEHTAFYLWAHGFNLGQAFGISTPRQIPLRLFCFVLTEAACCFENCTILPIYKVHEALRRSHEAKQWPDLHNTSNYISIFVLQNQQT